MYVRGGTPAPKAPPVGTVGPAGVRCPSTTPAAPVAVPPALAERPGDNSVWYGSADLWANAWFAAPDTHFRSGSDGTLHVKWSTFTLHDGQPSPLGGPPHVTAKRLERPATAVAASIHPTDYAATGADARSWWPTVIDFPAAGCWDITESRGTTTVHFTVPVLAGAN